MGPHTYYPFIKATSEVLLSQPWYIVNVDEQLWLDHGHRHHTEMTKLGAEISYWVRNYPNEVAHSTNDIIGTAHVFYFKNQTTAKAFTEALPNFKRDGAMYEVINSIFNGNRGNGVLKKMAAVISYDVWLEPLSVGFEVCFWCRENLKNEYYVDESGELIFFESAEDAAMFQLKFA